MGRMMSSPDPHGQAALMLCEGLALLLIEQGVLRKQRVVDTIDGVVEVRQEIAGVSDGVVVSMTAIGLLRGVARSVAAAPAPDAGSNV